VTGSCWEVAQILEPHVQRVIVVSPDEHRHLKRRRRPTSLTPAPWRARRGEVSLTRCGCPMSAGACCAAGSRAVNSFCVRERGQRTRSKRRWRAGRWPSRRSLTCSESPAAGGWLSLSCPSRSASPSTQACDRSRSWTQGPPRSTG
jgi:hypothetical protein